jgi:hypothetical protein
LLARTIKCRKIKNLQQRRQRSAATDRTDCDSRKKAVALPIKAAASAHFDGSQFFPFARLFSEPEWRLAKTLLRRATIKCGDSKGLTLD